MYGNCKLIMEMLEIHTFPHVDLKVWGWEERHGEWELTNGVLAALTWLTGGCVRTNFVWGPGWAPGCPDIWLHMTLGGFPWMILAFESMDSGEQIASQHGWPHPAHLWPEQNKRLRKGEAALSSLVWPGTLVLSCLGSQTAWNVNHLVPRFPGLWAQTAAAHLLASLSSLHYNKHIVINRQ